jgi:hypothetical protein
LKENTYILFYSIPFYTCLNKYSPLQAKFWERGSKALVSEAKIWTGRNSHRSAPVRYRTEYRSAPVRYRTEYRSAPVRYRTEYRNSRLVNLLIKRWLNKLIYM